VSQLPRIYNTFQLNTPLKFKLTPLGGLAIVRPYDRQSMYSGAAQAYATHTFSIASNRLNSPTHPVTWLHTKTRTPAVTVNMLSDSGADYSTLDSKYAPQLGIDLTKGAQASVQGTGGRVENVFYIHSIPFKIGNLKPYVALVAMGKGAGTDVFGRTAGLNWFDVQYSKTAVKYTELNNAQSGLGQARWRGRI